MKNQFYILNELTGENFDPIENKFYPANWEPQREEKAELEIIMSLDPEKFKSCIITE